MRIRIAPDRGVSYKGEHLAGGQEYDVDDVFGSILIQQDRAELVDTREPVASHRDPVVRRGTRG